MDRLTYKNNRGEWCIDKTKDNAIVPVQDGDKRYYIGEPIDRLAELENQIESTELKTAKDICGIITAKTYQDGFSKGMCWSDIVIDEIKKRYHIE